MDTNTANDVGLRRQGRSRKRERGGHLAGADSHLGNRQATSQVDYSASAQTQSYGCGVLLDTCSPCIRWSQLGAQAARRSNTRARRSDVIIRGNRSREGAIQRRVDRALSCVSPTAPTPVLESFSDCGLVRPVYRSFGGGVLLELPLPLYGTPGAVDESTQLLIPLHLSIGFSWG